MNKTNKPNIWFFGCSMTYGKCCHIGDEYHTKYYKDGDKIWSQIVANTLGYNEKNMGVSGCGNIHILRTLLDNRHQISNDDIVIVGMTDGARTQTFIRRDGVIIPETLSHWLLERYPWRENGIDEDFVYSLINYTANCRLPFIDEHVKYDKALIDDVVSLIKPINYINWGPELWHKFESIKTHTNEEIYDFHWSFNGHKEMAEWILNRLNKSVRLI